MHIELNVNDRATCDTGTRMVQSPANFTFFIAHSILRIQIYGKMSTDKL